ncbi:MAG TPA: hypothetical protein VJ549_04525 [Geothrix sp.]|nr:hypothetical protein [Geothrix sp.]
MAGEDAALRRVPVYMAALLLAGAGAWLLRSRSSALVFLVGGLTSLAFWALHAFLVGRMLTPSVKRRWLYGFLSLGKLALIVLVLRGMMERYPEEGLPLALGLLLFIAAILLEALLTPFRPEPPAPDDPPPND